ncbi:MAG: hypothetical protein ACRDS9_22825 [Pseudonocardiaceae bacterium]
MGDNHTRSPRAYVTTMSLLTAMSAMADEASLGDLALYLNAARHDLAGGPWDLSHTPTDEDLATLADGVSALLVALEELKEVTDDEVGLAAIAAARMYLADGIRHLDRVAERVAREAAELTRSTAPASRVDLRWVS